MDYINQLVNYKPRLMAFFLSKTGNVELSKDLYHDLFIKASEKLDAGKYTENGKYYNWLQMVGHNLWVDAMRRKNKQKKWVDQGEYKIFDYIQTPDPNPEDQIIEAEQYKIYLKAFDHLPEIQKKTIELNKHLTFKEIAEQTGESVNTWLGRNRYARINIKKYINKVNQYQLR